MSNVPSRVTVDLQQIADIAGVGRSAVGNWRKRHEDFPVPNSSGEFDLREVERWLIEKGKIDSRVPAAYEAWSLADTLRGTLVAEDTTEFLIAVLVYLRASEEPSLSRSRLHRVGERPAHRDSAYELTVRDAVRWQHLRQAPPDALADALLNAAEVIEDANPSLEGLLVPGLSKASLIGGQVLVRLIDSLERAADDTTSLFGLFEEVVSRASGLDRFQGEFSTPDDIAELMVRLTGHRCGTVLDPASGRGGLLLSAAIHPEQTSATDLIGYELNDTVVRVAKSRFYLYDVPADLRLGDVFRVPADELPKADVVLVDPPLNMSNWGDADVYLDARWQFGVPPRRSGDLAWLQLSIECLQAEGRAVAVTTTGTMSRGGIEADIRRSMLEAGVVDAVIQLPTRLRPNTSIPLALWILRPPTAAHDVLLIDASGLGTTGRSLHSFEAADIERIAHVVQAYERGELDDPEIAWIVTTEELLADNAIVEPPRYRPVPETNVGDVRRRAAELRSLVPATSVDAGAAVQRLIARLDAGGDR